MWNKVSCLRKQTRVIVQKENLLGLYLNFRLEGMEIFSGTEQNNVVEAE